MSGDLQHAVSSYGFPVHPASSLFALAALLHVGVRQANDIHAGETLGGIDLNLHDHPLQTDHCTGVDTGEHGVSLDSER